MVHKHSSCFKAVLECHLTLKSKCVPEPKSKIELTRFYSVAFTLRSGVRD